MAVGGSNSLGINNVNYIPETNYSILAKHTNVWDGELPIKTGEAFPWESIKERALISNTNKLIYQNDVDEIYANIISVFPEIDPMYGMQIREIVTNLPYFKNSVNYWVGLVAGEPPVIDGDETVDLKINEVIENSNFGTMVQNEIRSRFMDVISAYRVDVDIAGKPTIITIETKNLICFVSKIYTNSIEVNVIFNIYKDLEGGEFIEFIEYHFDGLIRKTVFKYSDGKIGDHLEDQDAETQAFNGRFKMTPIVVFRHNVINNEVYGTDQFRYWSASILGAMRELQNIFRLGERTRELIRKVPDSAIKKDPASGASVFFNKGTIGFPDGQDKSPDIAYIVPEIRMDEAVKAFEKAVKSVSIDTNLGPVFFDLEKLGTNLSAKSIEAALYPTKLEAKRITTEMMPGIKELVSKLCAIADVDVISSSKYSVMWFDGFPKDVKDYTDSIQERLGHKPSISLEDAIIKLDKVSSRIAIQKAAEIRAETGSKTEGDSTEDDKTPTDVVDRVAKQTDETVLLENLNTHDIAPTAGISADDSQPRPVDNTLWGNQMYPTPRDIPVGRTKGVRSWLRQKLTRKQYTQ